MNRSNWNSERLIERPAIIPYSPHDGPVLDASPTAHLFDSYGLIAISGVDAVAAVAVLLFPGRPTTVARLIVAAVVYSLQHASRRSWAHVQEKVFGRLPALTDAYATRAVVGESLVIRVAASRDHICPHPIKALMFVVHSCSAFSSALRCFSRSFAMPTFHCLTVMSEKPVAPMVRKNSSRLLLVSLMR